MIIDLKGKVIIVFLIRNMKFFPHEIKIVNSKEKNWEELEKGISLIENPKETTFSVNISSLKSAGYKVVNIKGELCLDKKGIPYTTVTTIWRNNHEEEEVPIGEGLDWLLTRPYGYCQLYDNPNNFSIVFGSIYPQEEARARKIITFHSESGLALV